MGFLMGEVTLNELEEILQTVKTVILPVGIVEQHGYHLPLNTDTILATEISRMALDGINAVVAPPVSYCYSGGSLTGTINVSPNVFSMMVTDICTEFMRTGFENIIILLGHGGNENTTVLKSALQILIQKDNRFRNIAISVVGVWELSKTWLEIFNMQPEHDWHAGLAETSVIMYLRPDLVRGKIVLDKPDVIKWMKLGAEKILISDKIVDHAYVIPHVYFNKEIKVGVFGFPEKANMDLGEKICREAVESLIEYVDFLVKTNIEKK